MPIAALPSAAPPAVLPDRSAARAAAPSAPGASALAPGGPADRTGAAFEVRLSAHLVAAPKVPPAVASVAPSASSPLAALLRGAEAAQARLDRLLTSARSGRGLAAADLLVLQAEAYRATQLLEVAGKVVEQGVQSVKQAIQTPL